MTNPKGWIVLGSPDSARELIFKDVKDGETYWTTHRDSKPGDYAFFYITAPMKSIAVCGKFITEPILQDDPLLPWHNHFFALIGELKLLKRGLSIRELKFLFPEWNYWKQPRSNALVPDDILATENDSFFKELDRLKANSTFQF